MKKLVRLASAVTSLSIAAIIGSAGAASANTDSMTYDHVEIGAANNGGSPEVWICSDQSSKNSFSFWVHSVGTGGNLYLTAVSRGFGWSVDGNNVSRVTLNPGQCGAFYIHAEYTVQVYAGSGSLTWGTNPIPWSQ